MADRRVKQRLTLFKCLPSMTDDMENAEVQDLAESTTRTALTLWMAGSSEDVGRWVQQGSIPLTECAAPYKGSYVGFRDTADHAAERHRQLCSKEGKPFDKKDMWLLQICLDFETFVGMSIDKFNEPGHGWVTRLHYETFRNSGYDWGVWYYRGKPFDLTASGVRVSLNHPI